MLIRASVAVWSGDCASVTEKGPGPVRVLSGIHCFSAETTWNLYWALLWSSLNRISNAEQKNLPKVSLVTTNMVDVDDIVQKGMTAQDSCSLRYEPKIDQR